MHSSSRKSGGTPTIHRPLPERAEDDVCKGGTLILTDCDNNSFWSDIGVKNPFNPHIEWHKHQKTQLWIDILSDAGFGEVKLLTHLPVWPLPGLNYVPGFES
jgi:hypothetical protein